MNRWRTVRAVREFGSAIALCLTAAAMPVPGAAAQVTPAGDGKRAETTSVDEQLLEGLGSPRVPIAPKPPLPQKPPAAGEDVGTAAHEAVSLPQLGKRMRQVEARLRHQDLSAETRQLQERIAQDLARLIDQQSTGPESGRPQPEKAALRSRSAPAGTSGEAAVTARGTPPGAPQPDDRTMVQSAQKVWGELPDRVRRQVQALGNEEFLPSYADLIRQYFQQLGERSRDKP